jgi:thiol-disulfide isomerase/thioredoxin
MDAEVLQRLLIAAAISGLGVVVYILVNRVTLRRAESKVARFQSYRSGLPALVYFTTPTCAPCKTVQRPAIEQLTGRFGRWFQVIEVDASSQPDVAQEWGVLSVPTTFVIDASGKPRYVNHGVTNAATLIKQLELDDFSI